MPIEKYKYFGSPYFYRYRCDDCERIGQSEKSPCVLRYTFSKWLVFASGKVYCPECLKRRSMGRLMFSWGKFLKVHQELQKETGIENEKVLYRLWQLRGVFPEAKISPSAKSDYYYVDYGDIPTYAQIWYEWRMEYMMNNNDGKAYQIEVT